MVDFIGKQLYKDSILVRCDCGCCMMEIYAYQNYNNEMEFGIDWLSSTVRKFRYPSFEFLCDGDFEFFKNTLAAFSMDMKPMETPNTLYTTVNLKNGKVKRNGRLEINSDDLGYINFQRYNKYEKGKLVWELCINYDDLCELSKLINLMYEKYVPEFQLV